MNPNGPEFKHISLELGRLPNPIRVEFNQITLEFQVAALFSS